MREYRARSIVIMALFFIGVAFSERAYYRIIKKPAVEELVEEEPRKTRRVKRNPSSVAEGAPAVQQGRVTIPTSTETSPKKHLAPYPEENLPIIENAPAGSYIPLVSGATSNRRRSYSSVPESETLNSRSNPSSDSSSNSPVYYGGGGLPVPALDSPSRTKLVVKVNSISLENGKLILEGTNLNSIKSMKVKGSALSGELVKISGDSKRLIAMGLSTLEFVVGEMFSLMIADAYGDESTYDLSVKFEDGSIGPEKLAPLGSSEDGYVLKWDAASEAWAPAPDNVGSASGSGASSLEITKGTGLVGLGAVINDGDTLAVDVGNNANQVAAFNASKKLLLNNTNSIELDQTSNITFRQNAEEFVFGMFSDVFRLRNAATNTTIFEASGNNFLVNGQAVCLANGDNCPTTSSGVTDLAAGSGIDVTATTGSVTVSIANGGITADKLGQMGAGLGQVLKWTALGWAAENDNDTNTGITSETDPSVRKFARSDVTGLVPESCAADQALHYDFVNDTLVCVNIVLDTEVGDAIANGETTKAPSQNAVFDALADKQNTIDGTSDVTMKYLKLMTDGAFWVGLKAPISTSGNLLFTLPGSDGSANQVLKTDGAGNLGWANAASGTITGITTSAPLSGSGTSGSVGLSLSYDDTTIGLNGSNALIVKNGGISNDQIAALAGIDWSKINKTGAVASDIGAATATRTIATGTGLVGGGDLSANRTLSVDVGTTVGKIVQLETGGKLPAVDGSQLTNLGTNLGKWSDATGGIQYPSGNVGIGTSTPSSLLDIASEDAHAQVSIQNHSSTADRYPGLRIINYAGTGYGHPILSFGNIGGSSTAPTPTKSDMNLVSIIGSGYDGTDFPQAARIQFTTEDDFSVSTSPANIQFFTTSHGQTSHTEKMRISADGKVGIGTSSPTTKLHVGGVLTIDDGAAKAELHGRNGIDLYSTTSGAGLLAKFLQASGNASPNHLTFQNINPGFNPVISVAGTDANISLEIRPKGTGSIYLNGKVGIGTSSPSEKLTIQDGTLLINQANAATSIKLIGAPAVTAPTIAMYNPDTAINKYVWWSARDNILFRVEGSTVDGITGNSFFTVHDNGNVGVGAITAAHKLDVDGNIRTAGCLYYNGGSTGTCASDERLKKDVHPFTLGLEEILGINPMYFKYNGLGGLPQDGKEQLGVIAQDIEKVAPGMIVKQKVKMKSTDKFETEIKAVDYGAFTYALINAVKELYGMVKELFIEKDEVYRRIANIESANEKLKMDNEVLRAQNEEMKAYMCQKDPEALFCHKQKLRNR